MAIDMTTVKKIRKPGDIYVKRIYLTNSAVVYKDNTSITCPVRITLFSRTTDIPTITANNLYDVLGYCGYTKHGTNNNIYYLIVDNPYEFVYNNGTDICSFAIFNSQPKYPVVAWFSVPGGTSTSLYQNWTITEDSWTDIGYFWEYNYEYKSYQNSTAGSYTYITIGVDDYGVEHIANYCANGTSYPEVTIVSASGDTYLLSNGEEITTTYDYSSTIESGKEITQIYDANGNIIWEKIIKDFYIRYQNYYINKGSGNYVTTATTASTVWHLEDDNRLSCTDKGTKYYLQCQKSGSAHTVFVDTTEDSNYPWLYENAGSITVDLSGTTYYLYRYGSGNTGLRMRTTPTTLIFEPVH